jgi:mutator protein MutT
MKARAVVILIEHGQVALIERRRQGRLFYVFPGGHVEPGETPEQGAVREAKEELGLDVLVNRLVAESSYAGRQHYYYLVTAAGGQFGQGSGKELSRSADSERGSVTPAWVALDTFDQHVILPERMAQLVQQADSQGWPDTPLQFVEPENWPGQ